MSRINIWRKISALLMNTDLEHPIEISCRLEGETCGMSTNDMLEVTSVFQCNDGTMWVNVYGSKEPIDMDDLSDDDLNTIHKTLVEVCRYDPKLIG